MLITVSQTGDEFYDTLYNSMSTIYGVCPPVVKQTMEAIPVIVNNIYFLLMPLGNLYTNEKNNYIIHIIDKNIAIHTTNVISVHNICNVSDIDVHDCFFDEHLGIMMIKYLDEHIHYWNFDIIIASKTIEDKQIISFNRYIDMDVKFVFKTISNITKIISGKCLEIDFVKESINLPEIPYIVCHVDRTSINPVSGTLVLNSEMSTMIGMVIYSVDNIVSIIEMSTILRFTKYFNCDNSTNSVTVTINDEFIVKTPCSSYNCVKIDGKIVRSINNINIDETFGINNMPINTYLWLNGLKIEEVETEILMDHVVTDEPKFEKVFITYSNLNYLPISSKNWIKIYDDKYIVQLSEALVTCLKPLMQLTDSYDYLYDYIEKNKYLVEKIMLIIDDKLHIQIINS